jgi:histidinol-phosphate aminotransferase
MTRLADLPNLIRPDIADLEAYTPILPLDVLAERLHLPVESLVKLDANENPYGPAPAALAALANEAHYAIYPDPEHTALRRALSDFIGQPIERILCGAGADEVIDLLLRVVLQPGDRIIDCPPTFGMYAFDTAINAGNRIVVSRRADFSLDLTAIGQAVETHRPKVLFIASPNNPSGNATPLAELVQLLQLPVLVVVDQAYIEFTDPMYDALDLLGQHENLVVLRTFSKWAGLAGLRIGYGVMHAQLATHLWKIKQPYNVNQAALVAALAALHDSEHLPQSIAAIVAERERLIAAVQSLGWLQPYPSQANFVLCRVTDAAGKPAPARAAQTYQHLQQQGILVRYYRKPDLHDCLRISVGTPAQHERLLAALRAMG